MLKLDDLVVDKEFEELLPVLTPEEFECLEQSVLKNGMLDPIKLWEEPGTGRYIIIDGHNRYRILKKNNISLNYLENYKIMYSDELPTREDVKRWMLEQQLGRRNLSDAEKYEIVQKFKSVFEWRAKQNQSLGGKGSSNLTKVDTRKEMAKAVGVSTGTYHKMDKIMKSNNEEVKDELRKKKISVDKAYQEISGCVKEDKKAKQENTPIRKIENIDERLNVIEDQFNHLQEEKRVLLDRRKELFEKFGVDCKLRYETYEKEGLLGYINKEARFFVEYNGKKQIYYEGYVMDKLPDDLWRKKVPEKYRADFDMLWEEVYEQIKEYEKQQQQERNKQEQKKFSDYIEKELSVSEEQKLFYKKCYRILAKSFHPDIAGGSEEDMQNLNLLKKVWGI